MTDTTRKFVSNMVGAAALAGLAACGGGGGGGGGGGNNVSPPPPPPVADVAPGGIFQGEITGCSSVCPVNSLTLIAEDGEWIGLDPDFTAGANAGNLTVTGDSFDSDRRRYVGFPASFGFPPTTPATRDAPSDPRSFDGTITERSRIQGTLEHNGSRNTRIDATYQQSYDNDSSLQTLAGMYSVDDGAGFTLTYSLDANGVFTGSDTTGCLVNGEAEIIDADYNMYRLELDFTSCGAIGAQGIFSGLGALLPQSGGGEELLFAVTSADAMVTLRLPKM